MTDEIKKRLITAGVAVPVLIVLFLIGGIPFFLLIFLVSVAGLIEMERILRARGYSVNRALLITLAFLVHLSAYINRYYEKEAGIIIYLCVLVFSCWVILLFILLKGDISDSIRRAALLLYTHLYINFPLSTAILLRNFEVNSLKVMNLSIKAGEKVGTLFLFFVIAVTFLNDTGAYFTGRKFGKTALAPRISPKKSVEGATGGIITGVITGLFIKFLDSTIFNIIPDFSYIHIIILGFSLGVAGIAGDLFESMMKRDAELKDAGGLLPGHGGILDRLDSLSFTIPLTYFYVKIFYVFF